MRHQIGESLEGVSPPTAVRLISAVNHGRCGHRPSKEALLGVLSLEGVSPPTAVRLI